MPFAYVNIFEKENAMRRYVPLILLICVSSAFSNINRNVILRESKKDWEEIEVNVLYKGNSDKPLYNIFIHHVNVKFKLPDDPFRLIYSLSSKQMKSFLEHLFENEYAGFDISRLASWEDVDRIESIDDYIITIKTAKGLYWLKILSEEPRKILLKKILLLPSGDDHPDLNVFLDRITF